MRKAMDIIAPATMAQLESSACPNSPPSGSKEEYFTLF
jgi:hypothetical protein